MKKTFYAGRHRLYTLTITSPSGPTNKLFRNCEFSKMGSEQSVGVEWYSVTCSLLGGQALGAWLD